MDICTRFTFLYAVQDKGMFTIACTLSSLFGAFGVPKIIQSDNGTEFANQLIHEISQIMNIDWRYITPYNPRANGLVEKQIGISSKLVMEIAEGDMRHWDVYLPQVQLAMNN